MGRRLLGRRPLARRPLARRQARPNPATGKPRGVLAALASIAMVAAGIALAAPHPAAAQAPGLGAHPEGGPTDGISGVLHGVPALATFSAADSESAWLAVKATASPIRQLRAIERRHLDRTICKDLVDLRAISEAGVAPFAFRDDVRGRSWARPSLALVLVEALRRFQREFPGRTVSLGDLSQPGCGPLNHGTLVRLLRGVDAVSILNRARVVLSRPTVIETLSGADFPSERWRFDSPDVPVRRETVILAQRFDRHGHVTLRVVQRRHRLAAAPDEAKLAELDEALERLARPRNRVSRQRVLTVDADGLPRPRWLTHWIDRRHRRQLVAVTRAKVGRHLRREDALELRLSGWQPKKPGSFKGEIRWLRAAGVAGPGDGAAAGDDTARGGEAGGTPSHGDATSATSGWTRWRQLYEAGHISHHSGRDADISWVTRDDAHHFANDLDAMDVPATWRWLELLVASGHDLGAPVELILVDPSVKRHLRAHLPRRARRSETWRLLHRSPGHTAHHHLRVSAVSRRAERRAKRLLERRLSRARGHTRTPRSH